METAARRASNDLAVPDGPAAAIAPLGSSRRLVLRLGAWSAGLGALLAFVANGLHPHPSDFRLEALLQTIALSRTWGSLHLLLILALVLILAALVALTFTLDGEPGATVARFALLAALIGGALILVSTSIDGFAMNQLARAWLDAPAAEKATALRIADALEVTQYAIYSLSVALFLGVGIFLYGLALVLSRTYPRPVGWLALLSGAGAGVVGVAQTLGGPELRATEIYFVLFSMLSTLWVLVMGVLMWRRRDVHG
jgi:hypothetical protein